MNDLQLDDFKTDENAAMVLLVDDQHLIRAGLRMLCESEPDLTVVGEADNGRDAIYTIRPDGTGLRLLAADAKQPAYSSNGERIAYIDTRGDHQDVAVMHADGSHRRIVLRTAGKEWATPCLCHFSRPISRPMRKRSPPGRNRCWVRWVLRRQIGTGKGDGACPLGDGRAAAGHRGRRAGGADRGLAGGGQQRAGSLGHLH